MYKQIIIFFFGFRNGYIFSHFWCELTRSAGNKLFEKIGYHLHHTLFILPALGLAILFSGNISVFLLGWGGAMIFHDVFAHDKRLVFITKE